MKWALRYVCVCLLGGAGVLPVWGADWDAERRALQSRVQAMSHGYYSEQEWNDILDRLRGLKEQVREAGRSETVIELDVLHARIEGDLWGDADAALERLDRVKDRYSGQPVGNMKNVYVQMARFLARQGDERGITELMREFEQSPYYDPEEYPFRGGRGPHEPLVVTRPHATGRDSITMSILQRYRVEARLAPGRTFPNVAGRDRAGRAVRLSDLRGTLVLLDFWGPGFRTWERDLPSLRETYRRYFDAGFQVIGVPLSRNPQAAFAFADTHAIPWPQWQLERSTLAELGLFGDPANFLIGEQGSIIARDVRPAELEAVLDEWLNR